MEDNKRREKKIKIKGISTLSVRQGRWKNGTNVKKITAKEIEGNSKNKRLSSMIFGSTEPSEYLEDGEYISIEEFKEALQVEFKKKEEDEKAIFVVGTKEYDGVDELISDVVKKSGAIKISDIDNPKIKTIDKRQGVLKKNTGEYIDKGPTILGKKIQLPSGLYINKQDIEGLKIAFQKEIEAVEPEKEENKKPEILKVVQKYKVKIAPLLLAIGIAIGSTGIDIDKPKDVYYDVSSQIKTENILIDEELSNFILGDSFKVSTGETVYIDSQDASTKEENAGPSKTIGKEFNAEKKFAGDYDITGLAITHNGKTVSYIENFNNDPSKQANLIDMVKETAEELGVDEHEFQVQIHLGSNNDNTRLGWKDVSDIFFGEDMNEIEKTADEITRYTGEIEDFEGDTITLENGVTIKVRGENGDLVEKGTKVIGSDGEEYSLDDISEENAPGINVKYNVNNIDLRAGILPALLAMGLLAKAKKENEKAKKEARYYEFDSDKEMEAFIKEFEKDPEKQKKLAEKVKGIFIKIYDEARKLTEEDKMKIQSKVDGQVVYPNYPKDKTGELNKQNDGGNIVKLTDGERTTTADIGMDNEVISTGHTNNITGEGANKNFSMDNIKNIDKGVTPIEREGGMKKIKIALKEREENQKEGEKTNDGRV